LNWVKLATRRDNIMNNQSILGQREPYARFNHALAARRSGMWQTKKEWGGVGVLTRRGHNNKKVPEMAGFSSAPPFFVLRMCMRGKLSLLLETER
jgi:hypothetical protein